MALRLSELAHPFIMGCYGLALLGCLTRVVLKRLPGWPMMSAIAIGLLAQTGLLSVRWLASGHLPVTGLFETQQFLVLWMVAALVYFQLRYRVDHLFPAVTGLALTALFLAGRGPKIIIPLTPAIDTPLFLIHVAASFAAYGLFGIAALAGLYQLFSLAVAPGNDGRRVADECLYFGFVLFTVCMIAGGFWAYLSWGSYWTWKIKGLWSYLLWFYYAGVIHIRNRAWWQGRPASSLTVVGFLLVLFTYLGLGLFFKTSHPLL